MENPAYETVYTIDDWYDGARTGVADFKGKPHFYQCELDFGPDKDYLLSPLDEETFQLVMEKEAIWVRWQTAFKRNLTSQETHPALPEDHARYTELTNLLAGRLAINPLSKVKVEAVFLHGENTLVKWSTVTGLDASEQAI